MTKKRKIEGIVVSGMGRGAYFVSLPSYKKFFEKVLGGKVFEGTLNIKLRGARWDCLKLNYKKYFPPNGHGAIYYVYAKLHGERILIIRPAKSTHSDDVIEIIASDNLREKYRLKDGDVITIELEEDA